jgi:hypothetical protein
MIKSQQTIATIDAIPTPSLNSLDFGKFSHDIQANVLRQISPKLETLNPKQLQTDLNKWLGKVEKAIQMLDD